MSTNIYNHYHFPTTTLVQLFNCRCLPHQVHGRGGTDGGGVKGFQTVDDITHGIQSLLQCERVRVVYGP